MKVLVADDSTAVRAVFAQMIRSQHHEVIEAVDGFDAVAQCVAGQPDLVLLDWTIKEMDGLETLRVLRIMAPSANVAIVIERRERHAIKQAMEAGALDVVVKPLTTEKLMQLLQVSGTTAP